MRIEVLHEGESGPVDYDVHWVKFSTVDPLLVKPEGEYTLTVGESKEATDATHDHGQ